MSDYLLSNMFSVDVPGLPDYLDKETTIELEKYPYAYLNQVLNENMQGSPEEIIVEITNILEEHTEDEELSKFLKGIGIRIDYKSKYWGGFNSPKEFLKYIQGFYKEY